MSPSYQELLAQNVALKQELQRATEIINRLRAENDELRRRQGGDGLDGLLGRLGR